MTAQPSPPLLITREPGLVVARLNRPERLNALSFDMQAMFADEIVPLARDPEVRVVMLIGEGRAFCAGGDVSGMGGSSDRDSAVAGMRKAHAWLTGLRMSDAIVICAVNGVAAGGGFGLALMGDVVMASDAASFKAGFTALGVAADFGLAWTLPRAVGQVRAREILLGERRIGAAEALAIGLVAQVFPAADFEAEALATARRLAKGPLAMGLTKRLLNHEDAQGLAAYLEAEAQTQATAFASEDFKEGVAAFMGKRPADFKGR
ncbi:MAG: enoyl-CoA hydratase [Caulobacteraceae bacterium]|nr:enoyl-CoA hydratase [Caulobacteraceae bacterium]